MQIKVRVNKTLKMWYSNQLSYEIIKYLYMMLILLVVGVGLEPIILI